ncbi:hypothetical protein H4R33_002136 [Dimargaris cristalligena]|uniref:Peroxiredoxin-like 2A n=1 Tax=Dimargaris cristalligena TaxID=215637 RepID=A0A4P9ZX66_9FUNG|nr:hypothetical protein H4R33_002136 [Dimargaris cristalligena]RKP37601.1 hypothetical protein BJ085DRAFT_37539 [Dimargaris cristalligena]|eukprot:RKP37601.1 hypothetical protein BJ085DRAFT_37539 [Dimargaris cristalligena]
MFRRKATAATLTQLVGLPLRRLDGVSADATPETTTIQSQSLWASRPVLVFVVRRPGCLLCREEAHTLAAQRATIETELGVTMVAVVHEELGALEFQEQFWRGPLYLDSEKGFFKAIGGGKLKWSSAWTMLLPSVFKNGRRATKAGVKGNFKGQGRIMGGLYIVKPEDRGIAFEYKEKVFGDHAPIDQVLAVCREISNGSGINGDSNDHPADGAEAFHSDEPAAPTAAPTEAPIGLPAIAPISSEETSVTPLAKEEGSADAPVSDNTPAPKPQPESASTAQQLPPTATTEPITLPPMTTGDEPARLSVPPKSAVAEPTTA